MTHDIALLPAPPPTDPVEFWNYYRETAEKTAVYPGFASMTGLTYVSLGLHGESGELCDQVKKVIRDDRNTFVPERHAKLCAELGDVLWYWASAARELGVECGALINRDYAPREAIQLPPGMGTPSATSFAALALVKHVAKFTDPVLDALGDGQARPQDREALIRRLGAIYHCARSVALTLDVDIRDIAIGNLCKLLSRRDRGTIHGSGDNR